MNEFYKFGLSWEEAKRKLSDHGLNKLAEPEKVSSWKILLRQFQSPLVYVLFVASGISLVVGHFTDASVILVVVVVNSILGFYQEKKADESLSELKKLVASRVKVVRSGDLAEINSEEAVSGDIVYLKPAEEYVQTE